MQVGHVINAVYESKASMAGICYTASDTMWMVPLTSMLPLPTPAVVESSVSAANPPTTSGFSIS